MGFGSNIKLVAGGVDLRSLAMQLSIELERALGQLAVLLTHVNSKRWYYCRSLAT